MSNFKRFIRAKVIIKYIIISNKLSICGRGRGKPRIFFTNSKLFHVIGMFHSPHSNCGISVRKKPDIMGLEALLHLKPFNDLQRPSPVSKFTQHLNNPWNGMVRKSDSGTSNCLSKHPLWHVNISIVQTGNKTIYTIKKYFYLKSIQ